MIFISGYCSFSKQEYKNISVNKPCVLIAQVIKKQKSNKTVLHVQKKYFHKISQGDNVFNLLKKSGVKIQDIFKLIQLDKNLNKIKINQNLTWETNKLGELSILTWDINQNKKTIYQKKYNNFIIFQRFENTLLIKKNILIKHKYNFIQHALQEGLNTSEVKQLMSSLQWKINFHNLSIGNKFTLVLSKNTKKLLGVKFNNSKKIYYFICLKNHQCYDIFGVTKKIKSIDFSFFKKYRISSKFNLHRMHPITHKISQHLGIDLAMPSGTSIFSNCNGEIIKTSFNPIAGLYIILKHKNYYVIRYMHLKKILVKTGDIIKKGQVIAFSGNSGRTTGPHLHYEVWIKNKPVDPINAQYLSVEKLNNQEKNIYFKTMKKILEILK